MSATSAFTCSPAFFDKPHLTGASILQLEASEAHNYTTVSLALAPTKVAETQSVSATHSHSHAPWS